MKEFVAMKIKTYGYLTNNNNEDKKTKAAKKCEKKKIDDNKHCLEATQLENKTNQLEKNKVNTDSLGENHKEFI